LPSIIEGAKEIVFLINKRTYFIWKGVKEQAQIGYITYSKYKKNNYNISININYIKKTPLYTRHNMTPCMYKAPFIIYVF